jgi:hypothetical protein
MVVVSYFDFSAVGSQKYSQRSGHVQDTRLSHLFRDSNPLNLSPFACRAGNGHAACHTVGSTDVTKSGPGVAAHLSLILFRTVREQRSTFTHIL